MNKKSHELILNLVDLGEHQQADLLFTKLNLEDLSLDLKQAYIKIKVSRSDPHEALLLFNKWNSKDQALLAEIYYLSGQYDKALEIPDCDAFVQADIYIAQGNYNSAEKSIKDSPLSAKWYYYMGRIYGHQHQFSEAIHCLERSIQLFGHHLAWKTRVLALMANYLYQNSQLDRAEVAYDKVRKLLKKQELKHFGQLKSDILMNLSYFQINQGQYFSALRSCAEVGRTLKNNPKSKNYVRYQLHLGYILKELGLYRRAISILLPINPKKSYYKMDRLRYLSQCNYELGEFQKAYDQAIEAAQFGSKKDPMAQLYLPVDQMRAQHALGETVEAQALWRSLRVKARTANDLEALSYIDSRYSELEYSHEGLNEALEFHKNHSFQSEVDKNQLCLAWINIKNREWNEAWSILNKMQLTSSPVDRAWVHFLLAVCQFKLGHHPLAQVSLEIAEKTASHRNLSLFEFLIFHLTGQQKNAEDLTSLSLYLAKIHKLNAINKGRLTKYLQWLELIPEVQYGITHGEHKMTGDIFVKNLYLSQSQLTVFDLSETCEIIESGERIKKLDKHPLFQKVLKFMVNKKGQWLSKEVLCQKAFRRNGYDPRTDDNYIYVNMNRLKGLFKNKKIVESSDGKYRISDSPNIAVIKKLSLLDQNIKNLKIK